MVANRIEVAVAMWLAWLRGGGFFGIDSFCSRLRASLSLIWCVMAVASHLVHLVFVVDLFAGVFVVDLSFFVFFVFVFTFFAIFAIFCHFLYFF